MLTKEEKTDCIKKACKNKDDTGSSEVQVTLLTKQIQKLNDHLKIHKKDFWNIWRWVSAGHKKQ